MGNGGTWPSDEFRTFLDLRRVNSVRHANAISPRQNGQTADCTASLTDWERSTDCEGEHDSVISVARVKTGLDDTYAPIRFSDLPTAERRILDAVTEVGGHGTCDPSDAFSRFVERVGAHREQQDGDMHVYLERDGTYYGLYVEVTDQVYAY